MSRLYSKILCSSCHKLTNHDELTNIPISDGYETTDDYDENSTIYSIIQCCGCDTVSYRTYKVEYGEEDEIQIQKDLFPIRETYFLEKGDFKITDRKIIEFYESAIFAFNGRKYLLCASAIRATIERICKTIREKAQKEISDNLEAKINWLFNEGYLNSMSKDALHKLRFMGNEALHNVETPTESEMKIAIDILELALASIFKIPVDSDGLKSIPPRQSRR